MVVVLCKCGWCEEDDHNVAALFSSLFSTRNIKWTRIILDAEEEEEEETRKHNGNGKPKWEDGRRATTATTFTQPTNN